MSGIQPHSKPVRPGEWVIFAANAVAADYVDECLIQINVPFKRLLGKFNGLEEVSWIVHMDDWLRDTRIQWLTHREHAVLILGERDPTACMCRTARVLTLEENPVTSHVGWFQEVGKKAAVENNGYSYDPQDHRYWIIVADKPVPINRRERRIGPLFYDFNAPHAAGRYPGGKA